MSEEPTLRGRKVYERHLDLMLAEELSCNPAFARFVFVAGFGDRLLPAGDPSRVDVTVSHFGDFGIDMNAAGEDDLLVEASWPDGQRFRLLVEDKLDAILQPRQIERYLIRAAQHASVEGVTAAKASLIAPGRYLAGHRSELEPIPVIGIEDIAKWLENAAKTAARGVGARLKWRARHLVIFDEGKRLPAPEMPQMIAARDRIVRRLLELAPSAHPAGGMRTAGSGWLSFTRPTALTYKVVHGVVDIYLDTLWPNDPARVGLEHDPSRGPDGFFPHRDSGGHPILRRIVRAARVTDRMRPISAVDEAELDRGADACACAVRWIDGHVTPSPHV